MVSGFGKLILSDKSLVVRRSATPEVAYHDQLDGPPREASGPAPDLQADFPRFSSFKFKLVVS